MAGDVECTAHADCRDGKMCTGLGRAAPRFLVTLYITIYAVRILITLFKTC